MTAYAVTADARVTRVCRLVTVPGPGGVPLYSCTCRPGTRTALLGLVLHAGEDARGRLAVVPSRREGE